MNRHFSKDDLQMATKHTKNAHITNYKGNYSQNHLEILFTCSRMAIMYTLRSSVSVRMWQNWNPCRCWWKCRMALPLWQRYGTPQKSQHGIPLLGKYLEESKHGLEQTCGYQCSRQQYPQQPNMETSHTPTRGRMGEQDVCMPETERYSA